MKQIAVKIFAVLFLGGFIAVGVWLAFFADGIWVNENGAAVNQILPKLLILVFLVAFPLYLLLWIIFPSFFNKLMYKGINRFMRGGAKMMEYRDRSDERNIPDVSINGVDLPTVVAAADMLADRIKGEDIAEPQDIPYICEECGTVLDSTAAFCTNCGAERKN